MTNLPNNPHAIIEIERPGFTGGESTVVWDSWQSQRLFKSVEVDLVTNETSQVRWSFFDPNFRVIDTFSGSSPIPQSQVRIYLGYGQNLGEPVFKGLLSQVERGQSDTTFIAFDSAFVMKLEKKAGYKNKKDDLAIIRELVTRNELPGRQKLKFEGPDKPLKLEPNNAMTQDQQTDWEHVMERAQDSGLVVFVRGDTLFCKYPAKVADEALLTFKNKRDFVLQSEWDFMFRTPENQDARPKVVKMRRRGKGGKRIEGQSDITTRGRERIVLKRDVPGKATKSKLSRRAQAQKELDREHAFEGQIVTVFPLEKRIDVRETIEITNIGSLFSGKYIVNSARHEFQPGRLMTNLELYRDIKE